jgi:multidrug transporter EmrE-like cation transporter
MTATLETVAVSQTQQTSGKIFSPLIIVCYILVGILWGCTNPFIKNAQLKNTGLPVSTEQKSAFYNLKKFVTDPLIFLPFIFNQSGSFFYYIIISSQPISIASPICNSLSFIFTAITGYWYFREELHSLSMLVIGILFILTGSYVCIVS